MFKDSRFIFRIHPGPDMNPGGSGEAPKEAAKEGKDAAQPTTEDITKRKAELYKVRQDLHKKIATYKHNPDYSSDAEKVRIQLDRISAATAICAGYADP